MCLSKCCGWGRTQFTLKNVEKCEAQNTKMTIMVIGFIIGTFCLCGLTFFLCIRGDGCCSCCDSRCCCCDRYQRQPEMYVDYNHYPPQNQPYFNPNAGYNGQPNVNPYMPQMIQSNNWQANENDNIYKWEYSVQQNRKINNS